MAYTQQDGARDRQPDRAAIFIDYDNLYRFLAHTAGSRTVPIELISEMLEGIQRSLLEDRFVQSAVARAYADFASLEQTGERIQRSLYLQGVEPHYVPGARDEHAVELQLCVDAMDLLHHRSDISTFVLLTGRRIYLPLVRMMRRYGRRVLVVGLDEPSTLDDIPQLDGDWYFPARDLLSSAARRQLTSFDPHESAEANESIDAVNDPILIRTLEIIEEHFGQY
ncbi:MAG: NYN domain-containing protein, partial [Rhodothermales bacterium]